MRSEIKTFSYPNGEHQRVQLITFDSWQQLDFLKPEPSDAALDSFARIYRKFLVPACPWLFGNMVLFRLPEDMEMPFPLDTEKYGRLSHRLTAAAAALERGIYFRGGKPRFREEAVKGFYEKLEQRNCLRVVRGKLPITTIIPVGNLSGFLTETAISAAMKVNASFFIMDRFDCATVYDHVGIPFGLCVKDGMVENPPLYNREALLVRQDGTVSVESVDVRNLDIEIGGIRYRHGVNATIFNRPRHPWTPPYHGTELVIVGNRVAAVRSRGGTPVPASGFVLRLAEACHIAPGDRVVYHGMEDVVFGIQVGNSIVRNGAATTRFHSRFYNIRHLEPVPYPPSLYPMNFTRGRAARIALGADKGGNPMLLWAEGAGKLNYIPGKDSCGASLSEMADICTKVGMFNAINLDGGGSAQILLNNSRSLLISDRKEEDNLECQRPVPLGLILR